MRRRPEREPGEPDGEDSEEGQSDARADRPARQPSKPGRERSGREHDARQDGELDRQRAEEERAGGATVVGDPLELGRREERLGVERREVELGHLGLPQECRRHKPGCQQGNAREHLGYRHASVRVAVLSDIHANLHALEAVLAAVEPESPDEVWFLGDLLGYGPRPNRCRSRLEPVAAISLVGNHDLASARPDRARLLLARGRDQRPLDANRARARDGGVPGRARAVRRASRRRPLPRQPARPGLGVRPLGGDRARRAARRREPDRLRRPQPRPARDLVRRRDGRRGHRRGRAARWSSATSAGSSIPGRSVSRATATRAPPGSSSTWTEAVPRSAASSTRSRRHRRRSTTAASPRCSPCGSSTASDGRGSVPPYT